MWTEQDIGDQTGRTALITGGNSGVGFATARRLHAHGSDVVLACRDQRRARAAATALGRNARGRPVRTLPLDLSSLASVRAAAERWDGPLDLLICNAGVMLAPPEPTVDGFEPHMGINHLGHFALVGLLLDRLLATAGSRVVVVASLGHRHLAIDPARLDRPPSRTRFVDYARSTLANLLFVQALHTRLGTAGAGTLALAAHPGGARTNIGRHSEHLTRRLAREDQGWRHHLFQEPEAASLSVVRAATDPAARGGEFYGPDGLLGLTGGPALTRAAPRAYDRALQHRLWTASEESTGVRYRFPIAR